MVAGLNIWSAVEAEGVTAAMLAELHSDGRLGVVLDSPPCAGKSTLLVQAVKRAATGEPFMVIAQTNQQPGGVISRLLTMASAARADEAA